MFDRREMEIELSRVSRLADQLTDNRSERALCAYADDLRRWIAIARNLMTLSEIESSLLEHVDAS